MSVKVKFVVTSQGEEGHMLKAAQAVQSARLPTERILSKDVLNLEKKEKHLYVIGQFSGAAFDHLVGLKCRVVGPQCVISCLELQVAVPNVPHPINNIAMQDVVVSCSSVEKAKRENLHQLIQWMGGRVSRDFTEMVTHLVVGEVGSKKYHVAANLKKPIMLPEWIEAAWEESQHKHFSGTTSEFMEMHKCPAFKGCIICVTGLEGAERQEIKNRVGQHGGHYTGELKYNECTHLIVGVSRGPKFEFARKWKIHTVSIQWFYDSIEAGYCLDEQLYSVISQEQSTSTPVKTAKQQQRLSTLSNISAINMSSIHPVDETAMTEPSIAMETSGTRPSRPSDGLEELDKLDPSCWQADMFLDGCKIFLSGFGGQHLEKLRRIVNAGGGTRFNQINENVSHVVIGNRVDEHIAELKSLQSKPHLVSVQWLIECIKSGRQVSEGDFELRDILEGEDDKENEVTFKLPERNPKKAGRMSVREKSDDNAEDDIMSQYLPTASRAAEEDNDITIVQEGNASRRESAGRSRSHNDTDETHIDEKDEEEEGYQAGNIFAGKRFVVMGFTEEQEQLVSKMIPEHAGVVLPASTRAIPDYAVVPIFGWPVNLTVNEIVTNCWLQMCLETQSVLDPSSNVLFTPIAMMKNSQPLQDCVLSISQYSSLERDCLLHIAELLGARCQEYFVRKAVNNLEANTHLLLRDPEGTKYMAAKKWKVPAVTTEWLLACARTGQRQAEKDYLVDLKIKEEVPQSNIPNTSRHKQERGVESEVPKSGRVSHDPKREPEQNVEEPVPAPSKEERGDGSRAGGDATAGAVEDAATERRPAPPPEPIKNKVLQGVKGQTPGRDSTPSRLLRPGFKPSFDLEEAVAALDSPGMSTGVKGSQRRKSSLPLDEFFHQNIANALQFRLGSSAGHGDGEDGMEDGVFKDEEPAPGILHGVIICVSKKLSRKQSDYNTIAMAMGAEYRWTYDETCTHFIFQGKANDITKEFRLAKSQGKTIVSPHWLMACQEENKRVDEAQYPHTYNPKLSLSVVASRSQTPARQVQPRPPPVPAVATPVAPPQPKAEKKLDGSIPADSLSDEELMRAVDAGEQEKAGQDLQKQLDNIMSSSMNLRGSRRGRRRHGNSVSGLSIGGDATSGSDGNVSGRRSSRLRSKRSSEKTQPVEMARDIGLHTEASQSVQITWDDPTSRREKERILAKLKQADNEHTDSDEPGEDGQQVEEPAQETPRSRKEAPAQGANADDTPPTPTPKAPPIRLPLARPAVAPQPRDEIEDEVKQEAAVKQQDVAPKFLFSGMSQQEKIDYSALVEQLGGVVKDAQYFDASCSHIIVGNPTRNEKYLAALATGKWVLHKSYLEACREARGFVEEEPHEWGNQTDLSKLSETGKKMALAATRWRAKLQDQERAGCHEGAFDGWKVLLLVEKSKEMCFKRLLEAGGAKVLAVRPPFSAHRDANHAFFDLHKVKADASTVALEDLVQSGVLCLKPEYIADFLVHDPSPDPENYIINEAKPIIQKLVEQAAQGSKRRPSEAPSTPRSKRTRHR
ncbi:DNA topoisomerase 2-binding protein 1-like [Diadema antillarum]|uniref:DNA topoisomerase 2-binding protein 1-like n=1 Tax=Diadema antillarum TaxID=105358 RepID=UPI003A8713A8